MRSDVATDLGDSAFEFLRVVWPQIKSICNGGRIEPVEAVAAGQARRDLDVLGGIDAWQYIDHLGVMRGIASRVQWPENGGAWRSFTVRHSRPNASETECVKRPFAIRHGYIYPALTVQAYIAPPRRVGDLLLAAVAMTAELFEYIGERHDRLQLKRAPGGERFHPIWWDDYKQAGYRIAIVPSERRQPEFGEQLSLLDEGDTIG